MKNLIIALLSISAVISCEKKQDKLETDVVLSTPPNDLAKDGKKAPLTTATLSEPNFDFGKIEKGKTVEHTYEILNTGNNPLIISSVNPACGCTIPEYTHEPILPGKKGKITLNFNSANFEGAIHKSAEVFANTEKAPITLTFTGNVIKK